MYVNNWIVSNMKILNTVIICFQYVGLYIFYFTLNESLANNNKININNCKINRKRHKEVRLEYQGKKQLECIESMHTPWCMYTESMEYFFFPFYYRKWDP